MTPTKEMLRRNNNQKDLTIYRGGYNRSDWGGRYGLNLKQQKGR